jgi:hypothetical protein
MESLYPVYYPSNDSPYSPEMNPVLLWIEICCKRHWGLIITKNRWVILRPDRANKDTCGISSCVRLMKLNMRKVVSRTITAVSRLHRMTTGIIDRSQPAAARIAGLAFPIELYPQGTGCLWCDLQCMVRRLYFRVLHFPRLRCGS